MERKKMGTVRDVRGGERKENMKEKARERNKKDLWGENEKRGRKGEYHGRG